MALRGRPCESPSGRKRRFEVLLTPEQAGHLETQYGSVQRAVRAFVAGLETPQTTGVPKGVQGTDTLAAPPTPVPSPPPCARCARIGAASCPACRQGPS